MQRQASSHIPGACFREDVYTVSDSDDNADAGAHTGASVIGRVLPLDHVGKDLCIRLEDSPKTMAAKRGSLCSGLETFASSVEGYIYIYMYVRPLCII